MVLADAEAYARPLHVLERLGRFLDPGAQNLGRAHVPLSEVASSSPLARTVPTQWPAYHRAFQSLLWTVREYRNDAMHVGARARHLTRHVVEVCLVLEDALSEGLSEVADFMVSSIVFVNRWQPVSYLRQQMLENSFTYIPVAPEGEEPWLLIADHQLAQFLSDRSDRKQRLATTVEDALASEELGWSEARKILATASIPEAVRQMRAEPLLVESDKKVVGIVTAFDLL